MAAGAELSAGFKGMLCGVFKIFLQKQNRNDASSDIRAMIQSDCERKKTHPKEAMLSDTTNRMANNAVVFLTFDLTGDPDECRSFSSVAILSRSKTFSWRRFWFSLFKSEMVASRDETYSFFFLRDRHADSRFLIIRCCRFSAFTCRDTIHSVKFGQFFPLCNNITTLVLANLFLHYQLRKKKTCR